MKSIILYWHSKFERLGETLARCSRCRRFRREGGTAGREVRLNGAFDRRTPGACSAHVGSRNPADATPATIPLPARSSCEWAGSLVCVSPPFGAPVQRVGTSRRSIGRYGEPSNGVQRAFEPANMPNPRPSALHFVPADHSTVLFCRSQVGHGARVCRPRARLLATGPRWCVGRAWASTRGLCWPLGSLRARFCDVRAELAALAVECRVDIRAHAHHGFR